jgi:uncharacterized protein YcbK (DUF882 family)
VSLSVARGLDPLPRFARAGARIGVAGLCLIAAGTGLQSAIAEGDTRTLSFHHVHSGEDLTVTFKRNGRYDQAALKKLDWFMRDWRTSQPTHMDPHLFDLLWETYREVDATQPIQVIGGYRSPRTNAMLRARSSGVAQFSQHMRGHAIDFYIPGVPLEKVRIAGLRLQSGGVGFYPTSGSPFVHLDTGKVRHWPRMTYAQLQKIFPDGRTVHVASNGRPLPRYAKALADVERRGNVPNGVSLAAARDAGKITAIQEREAEEVAQQPQRNLLADLFSFGTKQKDAEQAVAAQPVPAAAPEPRAVANAVPLPAARPEPDGAPLVEVADADSAAITGSVDGTRLAYAPESDPPPPVARARPMGAAIPKFAREASALPLPIAAKPLENAVLAPAMAIGGQRAGSPWLRAAMLTPSVSSFMTTTRLGAIDPRPLHTLLHKPAQAVLMTFSADPALGMLTERFTGKAVVFVAVARFTIQTTAALP